MVGTDLLSNSISVDIQVHGEQINYYKVVFHGVVAHFYSISEGHERLKYSHAVDHEGAYLELTTISYHPDGLGRIGIEASPEEWATQWFASANFHLEIWSASLFIEAKAISIDGKRFEVGFPPA